MGIPHDTPSVNLTVNWIGGEKQSYHSVPVDTEVILREGRASPTLISRPSR
jgi:hypothetical protein